jgi:CobQ/CobB/MinD/ParA nucleotide binding domain
MQIKFVNYKIRSGLYGLFGNTYVMNTISILHTKRSEKPSQIEIKGKPLKMARQKKDPHNCPHCGATTSPRKPTKKKTAPRQPKKPVASEAVQSLSVLKSNSSTETVNALMQEGTMESSFQFIVSPKGGVGKSGVAALLAGYCADHGLDLSCIDADPTIKTFATFKRFNAERVQGLIDDDNEVDARAFDGVVEKLIKERKKIHVVDTGSSGFVVIMNYLIMGDILEILRKKGKKIYFHIPIVGGQAQEESIFGMENIIRQIPDFVKVIVWINEYNFKVKIDGKGFLESPLYAKYKPRILAAVTQAKLPANTFGADMTHMLKSHMSFSEAVISSEFSFAAQGRLRKTRKILYAGLDQIFGLKSSFLDDDEQEAAE